MMLPYLRVANVQDGRLNLSEIKTVEALPSDLEKLRLRSGDVLLTEGGDYDKLGRGALWEGQIDDCIHQNHIFRVRTDRTKLLPVVFANYLRTSHAKAYFLRCAKKTTNLATINMRQLRALPVPLPPVTQQQQFQEEYEVIRDLTKKCTDAFVQAGDMFASLAQRAFRGEL
jgi:type I restriction enzyme S subunit